MTTEATDVAAAPAELALLASLDGRKLPRVEIVAYTGGVMNVPGWGDVAIELAGLELPGTVPIVSDHDSTRRGIVGHGRATVRGGRLLVAGSISAGTQAAREIVEAAKNGFPWQASVAAEVLERRQVPAGQTVAANGQSLTAPAGGLTLIARGRLREVSIVGIGCDSATSVAIAASRTSKEQTNMDVHTTDTNTPATDAAGLEAARLEAAEAARVESIRRICAGRHAEIEARAVADGWDATRTELEVLRADRPKVTGIRMPQRAGSIETIEAAVLTRMGKAALGEKALGPVAMEQARRLGATCLLDLCRAALVADGQEPPHGKMELVKAALSTYTLPVALGNVANKVLLDAYNDVPATWRAFASVRSVPDFKTNSAIRPSFTGALEPVAHGGELRHGTVGESVAQFSIDTFGKLLSIDRRDIVNDDLGLFQDAAAAMGRAAMRKLSDLVYEVLLANAAGFFSTGNRNLLTGADSALSFEALAQAIALMRTQRDAEGNDLDLKPATLLVGPELEPTARALLESEFIQRPEDVPTGNSLRRAVNLEVEPRLNNATKYGTAASAKHWYLFAAPSYAPMVVAFLNGLQTPTVEFFGLEQTVERLAVTWRVYHDFGAALVDPRAAVRSKGEA